MTWTVLAAAVTFWCIGAAWGGSLHSKYEHLRYSHLVAADAGQRAVIRGLFDYLNLEPPEFYDDPEPEPRTPRWRRLWAWSSDRMEPVAAEAVEEAEEGEEQNPRGEANQQVTVEEQPDEPERDWRTDTGPIVLPEPTGPATVPSQAVIADDWAVKSAAMLAEWKAASEAIGGGR